MEAHSSLPLVRLRSFPDTFSLGPTMGSKELGIGFVTANVVPASSASLGYVLIAGGSVELATALAIVSVMIGIPAIPFFLSLYSSQVVV